MKWLSMDMLAFIVVCGIGLNFCFSFAEGGDLYKRLREQRERNEHLSEVQVVRWFIQICMALQYLHQQHILHRDLKTQNIFLTKTKMIKVK